MIVKVTVDGETFDVEVGDLNTRPVIAYIEGERFEVWPEAVPHVVASQRQSTPEVAPAPTAATDVSRPAQNMPAAPAPSPASNGKTGVVAPIPGVIESISVSAGDSITVGQQVCVLEAMKMKNIIRSTRAGTIASINVNPGQQVNHGDVLMTFAEE